MRVRGKAGTGIHPVFVDHSESAENHMLRIIIIAEQERVAAIERVQFRFSPFIASP
jgi:hypothetical protein